MNPVLSSLLKRTILNLSLSLSLSLLLISCSKEGCRDAGALNFDPKADKDGPCQYTKVIFYAGSDRIGGVGTLVTRIEVFQRIVNDDELIGTITTLNQNAPQGCVASEGAIEFQFTNPAMERRFPTRYYFEDGTEDTGTTYFLSTSNTTECLIENLTL